MVLYFGRILHHYNFRKSEYFRQMSSGSDTPAVVSCFSIGILPRYQAGQRCCNQQEWRVWNDCCHGVGTAQSPLCCPDKRCYLGRDKSPTCGRRRSCWWRRTRACHRCALHLCTSRICSQGRWKETHKELPRNFHQLLTWLCKMTGEHSEKGIPFASSKLRAKSRKEAEMLRSF